MGKTISVRLDDKLTSMLENVSNEIERDTTFIVKKALEQYLSEYIDYQIALDRLRDKDDKLISAEEMWRRLGVWNII